MIFVELFLVYLQIGAFLVWRLCSNATDSKPLCGWETLAYNR